MNACCSIRYFRLALSARVRLHRPRPTPHEPPEAKSRSVAMSSRPAPPATRSSRNVYYSHLFVCQSTGLILKPSDVFKAKSHHLHSVEVAKKNWVFIFLSLPVNLYSPKYSFSYDCVISVFLHILSLIFFFSPIISLSSATSSKYRDNPEGGDGRCIFFMVVLLLRPV